MLLKILGSSSTTYLSSCPGLRSKYQEILTYGLDSGDLFGVINSRTIKEKYQLPYKVLVPQRCRKRFGVILTHRFFSTYSLVSSLWVPLNGQRHTFS